MSWFQTGYDGVKKEEERLASQYGPDRYWMKPEERRSIVWIDDDPACIHEHNPQINGDWKNWFTCAQGVHEDVYCCEAMPDSRAYVGYLTVVDCSSYVDSRGNTRQFELKLFPAKLRTLKILQGKKTDRDNRLKGRVFRVTRTDENTPGCGNDFEFERDVEDPTKLFHQVSYKGKKLSELFAKAESNPEEMEKLKKIFDLKIVDGKIAREVPKFNYFEVLKPKNPRELREMLRGARIAGKTKKGKAATGGDTGGGSRPDDDIPF